jgi:hypothetical protein
VRPAASSMDALRMLSPGGAVILSLRTARSVYAGGGVEEEGRRLKRSSCELEEEDGEEKEEEGAYAGGSVIVVVTVPIFPVFLPLRGSESAWESGIAWGGYAGYEA